MTRPARLQCSHRVVITELGRGRDVLPTPAISLISIGAWAVLRRRNPGLGNGIVLFLSLGIAILATAPAGIGLHLFTLVLVVGIHAAIVVDAGASSASPAR